jgi:tetratricopeptide (TPR) repeat protein
VLAGDDAFRFRHVLIRDAAYEGLPKSARADLHERFAGWLDGHAEDLAERDELIGYHLERAYRYRQELGPADNAAQAVARAAARRLESAGRRALERGDSSAALNLLERASGLASSRGLDVSLELSVAWALFEVGRVKEAAAWAGAISAAAAAEGDRIGELRAELASLHLLCHVDPEGRLAQLQDLVDQARPVFEQAGDQAALASLDLATWSVAHIRCQFGAAAEASLRGVEHATAAGDQFLAALCLRNASAGITFGPMPVAQALDWYAEQGARLEPRPTWIVFWRSQLLPLIGRFEEARAAQRENLDLATERGDRLGLALNGGWRIEMEAGEFAKAEEFTQRSCELLEEMGERSHWSTKACELAQALCALGRYSEADDWARRATSVGASDDAITQLMSRQVRAKVAARQGQFDAARREVAEAVALAEGMDAPVVQGDAYLDAAEVLWLAGDAASATEQAERAAAEYERKGATTPLARARDLVATIKNG